MSWAMLAALIFGHWQEKPPILRDGLLTTLVPLVAACALFGFLDELRDYYEAYPIVVALVAPEVARLFGAPFSITIEMPPRAQLGAWLRSG
jgi:hypothetical protein